MPDPDTIPLNEDDTRELTRFTRDVTARNAHLVGEKRYREEFRHWLVELYEPGGNTLDEFNFKAEAAADLAIKHGTDLVPS